MLPGLLPPPTINSGPERGEPQVRWRVRTGTVATAVLALKLTKNVPPPVRRFRGSVAVSATSWVVFMFSTQPELKNPGRQTDTKGQ